MWSEDIPCEPVVLLFNISFDVYEVPEPQDVYEACSEIAQNDLMEAGYQVLIERSPQAANTRVVGTVSYVIEGTHQDLGYGAEPLDLEEDE